MRLPFPAAAVVESATPGRAYLVVDDRLDDATVQRLATSADLVGEQLAAEVAA